MKYKIDENTIIFSSGKNEIGSLIFNISNADNIYSEYNDSIDGGFDEDILRRFDYNKPIINIEDV